MDYRVISIGTLSAHELWHEKVPIRTAHSTTTLVRNGEHVILVDPGLPAPAIAARLKERSGLDASEVTDIFLTNFRPAHRAGLTAFDHAKWWISESERESTGKFLIDAHQRERDEEVRQLLAQDIAILKRFQAAPDRLAEQVDLFPLSGYTPGTCGLLLCQIGVTTLIAGDAVPTLEHLEQGRVLKGCYDAKMAQESFMEAVEIADVIVPGHDNLIVNPTRRGL